MRQYTHSGDFSYNDPAVNNVTVMKVRALKTEAKAFGY